MKNTSTAIFRTATGGKARDFDIPNIKADDNNYISLKLYADLSLIYPWHNICEIDPTAHLQCQNRSIQTSLAIFGDTRPEENETVILELRNQPNAVEVSSTAGTATYTILNDDGTPPTITISGGAAVTEGTAAGFTLNSSPAPSEKLTVQLDVSDKEDNGSNFVAARDEGRKTVSIGTSGSATYTVPTDDDNTDEPHGVVTVTIAEGDGYTVGNTSSAMVTVNDDDVPVTITESGTPAATTVSEDGATTDTYTVVLNSAPSHSVTVTATAGDGARVQGSGGTAGPTATLTFTTTNWNQAQTITVTGVDDDIDNAGDARIVTIAHAASSSDPSFAIADAGSVSVTVTDDDTAGLVFKPDPVSVYEGDSGSYTVALASQPSANVTVTISGQGGTDLKVDTDSVMAGDQATLTFTTSNWSVAQPVSIEAAQDNDVDNDSITLAHAPSGGGYGSAQSKNLKVTITDDNTAPQVTSIDRQSPTSEYTNADSLTWRVTFNEAVVNVDATDFQVSNTTAKLAVSRVVATNAYDVTASAGNLASLDATVTLSFNSSHDIQDKSGKDLASSPTLTGTNNSFVVDNTAPTVTITGLSGTIYKPVTATFTFSEPVNDFEVGNITVGNGTASAFTDTSKDGTVWTATITPTADGKTVTVDVAANVAMDEAGNPNTAATPVSANYIMLSLVFSPEAPFVDEGGTGGYTVKLSRKPSANVTVTISGQVSSDLAVDTDSGMAGDQATLTFTPSGTGIWSTGQTVLLRASEDNDSDHDTVTLKHDAVGGNYDGVSANLDVSIDDDEKMIEIDATTIAEGETKTFTMVNIPRSWGDGTPHQLRDLDGSTAIHLIHCGDKLLERNPTWDACWGPGGRVWGPKNRTHKFPMTAKGKDGDEPNETVQVGFTDRTAKVHSVIFTIQIIDKDPTTVVLSGSGTVKEGGSGSTEATVTLGRNLVAGESVTVPLSVSGTGVTASDYKIALKNGSSVNSGVILDTSAPHSASAPAVVFTGHDTNTVQVATLTVTAPKDTDDDEASETLTVGFGSGNRVVTSNLDLGSGTGTAGTTPTGTATVTITDDGSRGISVSPVTLTLAEVDDPLTESDSEHEGTYRIELESQPTGTVTVNLASGDRTIATLSETSLEFTPSDWDAQTVTVTAVADDIDNAGDARTVRITHTVSADGTDYKDETAAAVDVTITDADGEPTLSIDSPSVAEGDSSTTTLTFKVTLSPASGKPVTVAYADATTGTATLATDYAAITSGTLNFAAGQTEKTVTVTVNGDTTDEPNETVVLRLSSPSNAALSGGAQTLDGTGTITDDDGTPTVTLKLSSASIAESGADNASTVTASLSGTSSQDVTLTVAATAVSPAVADEFALSENTTLTIAAGATESSGTVTITAVDNDVDAANKTVTVSATATGGNGVADPDDATLTITDDDTRGVTVAGGSLSMDEADQAGTQDTREDQASYTVVLDSEPTDDVSINIAAPAMVTLSPTSLTFTPSNWDQARTVTATAVNDAIDNAGDERAGNIEHAVMEGDSDYAGVAVADVAVTVNDDDGTPVVTLELDPASIAESGDDNSTTVTASLSGASSQAVTLAVAAAAVSPAATGDFTVTANKTLTIAAGATESTGTVTITAVDNDVDAANKTVTVSATATGGNGVANPADATLTITDDDTRGISVSPVTLTLAEVDNPSTQNTSEHQETYSVELDSQPTGTVTVNLASGDTKIATLSDTSLDFTPSDWDAQTVTVTAVADDIDNAGDARTVRITHTVSATGTDYKDETAAAVDVTVTDDDGEPMLSIDSPSVAEGDSSTATMTFKVTLSPASGKPVTVAYADAATGTATSATDYAAISPGTLNFAAGQTEKTVAVTVNGDTTDEPNETVVLRLSSPSNAALSGGAQTLDGTGTINDDDDTPTVSVADATAVNEGNDPDTTVDMSFTVSLSAASANTVTVPYTLSGTATGGSDYETPSSTSLSIAAGDTSGTIVIKVKGDALDEPNETIIVTLGAPTNATVSTVEGAGTGTGTINDDDGTPSVTLELSSASITENGGSSTVTASLSGASSQAVTLTVAAAAVSPAVAGDYTLSGTTLTIAAGSTTSTGTVTITAVDNDVDAANKTVTVSATASGGGVADPANATLTITDDDTRGVTVVGGSLTMDEADKAGTQDTREDQASYTVVLDSEPTDDVRIDLAAPAMVTLSPTSLTFTPSNWNQAQTVTATAVNDAIDNAGNERTGSIAHAVVAGDSDYAGVAAASVAVTVNDDDGTPAVTLKLSSASITENGGSSTVTASLSGASSQAVTLTVAAAAVSPAATGDYTLSANTTLTIAAGATESTGAVTIAAADNDVDAANKTVTVSATASGGGVADPDAVTLTITDDDDRGISVSPVALTLAEVDDPSTQNTSEHQKTYSIELDSQPTGTVTVNLSSGDTTIATLSDNSLEFTTSDWDAQTVTVTAVADTIDNAGDVRTVTITHTVSAAGTDYKDEAAAAVDVTVTDDDGEPTLSIDAPSIAEGDNSTVTMTFKVTLSPASGKAVSVAYADATTGTATSATDYAAIASGTLNFAAGQTEKTVDVTVNGDTADEPNETVVLRLSSPSNAALSGGAQTLDGTGTITDDDGTPTVSLELDPASIDESGADNATTVTATLSSASHQAVTLTIAAAAVSPATANDYTFTGTTLTIAAGATTSTGTVTITAVDNDVDAPNKTVTVSATASGGGVANPDDATLTITDDDDAPSGITLSVSPATLGEGDGETEITVTATVNGATRYLDAKTVTVSVGGGTAVSGTDYGAVSNFDITIAAGDASKTGTFDLTPTDDTLHEEDETIEVTGTSGTLTITPDTVTITDNDASGPAGTVSLSASRYEVLEGDSLSVTVKLSESPAADTVIELEAASPSGYTATSGVDYDGAVQTVTIRAGATSGKARISTTRDNLNDPNETFRVAIRASDLPGTVTLGEPHTAVVTIQEPVSGITPPATATVKYAGRNSRIPMPVPAGMQGHGIDVAFYFETRGGTARGGADCREDGTDLVVRGVFIDFDPGTARNGPVLRIIEDINTNTIELDVELCEGSVGKIFFAAWDTASYLGDPDRGYPGVKSAPFNAGAAHCSSTALCLTKVTITGDTPDPDPEVTIAAGDDDVEGADAVFTVQASPAPTSDLEIALAIADDDVSDFLADGDEGSKTVTIVAGSDTATYTLATTDDDLDEANGEVSATLKAGTGYQVGSPSSATVAVADNDDDDGARTTVVGITGGADITEGSDASFTLTGAPAPSQDITVNLRVTQSGAFAGDGELGTRTVTLGADATVTVDIPTVDDSTLEDDGSLTVTIEPGTGYTPHATDASATVAVADDEVPSLPTIHIDDVEAPEGEELHFTFTLSHAVDHEVTVWWETRFGPNPNDDENGHGPSYGEASSGADFRFADSRVTVYPGGIRGEFWVQTFEDSHDEGREHFTIVLTDVTGAIIADELAIGTIVNSDPMPAAWLGRFGRAVAEQAIEGISERIESAGRPGGNAEPGFRGTIGGITLGGQRSADEDSGSGESDAPGDEAPPVERPDGASSAFGFGAGAMPSQPGAIGYPTPGPQSAGSALGTGAPAAPGSGPGAFGEGPVQRGAYGYGAEQQLAQMLLGSHFSYTGKADEAGGVLGYWGRGAQTRFDGAEGNLNLDGEVTTAMLGVDYARNNWLVGVALTQSLGSGGYRGSGTGARPYPGADLQGGAAVDPAAPAVPGATPMDGAIETSLTAAIPYASWRASERLSLWGAAGYGVGEMTLEPGDGESLRAGIGWSMAAAGLRSDLFSFAGGTKLDLISDALWARTGSERIAGLVATESAVSRLRLGVEASREFSLPGGGSLAPRLEVGARRDGGSAEVGFGVEVGGGISWTDPRFGLKLDLLGRTLISHEDDAMSDKGFSASLAFDPRPDSEQGLALTLRQDIGGTASGGLDAMFSNDPLARRMQGSDSSRLTAELGYGWALFGDRFIGVPHLGYSLTRNGREIGVGWRLAPDKEPGATDITLKVLATRAESLQGEPADHRIGIEVQARW